MNSEYLYSAYENELRRHEFYKKKGDKNMAARCLQYACDYLSQAIEAEKKEKLDNG